MSKSILKAFTLIEIIIYMALFSTLLIVLSTLFSTIIDQQFGNKVKSAIETDYFFITSRIKYESYLADKILTPSQVGDSSLLFVYEVDGKSRILRSRGNNLELIIEDKIYQLNSSETMFLDASFKRKGNIEGRQIIEIKATLSPLAKSKSNSPLEMNLIFAPFKQ